MKKSARILALLVATAMLSMCVFGCTAATPAAPAEPATPAAGDAAPAEAAPAAQAEGGAPSEFVIAVASGPNSFDCQTSSAGVDMRLGYQVFEQLIIFNKACELTPQLATSFESNDDNTEWTFKLKEGVTFHDGSAFTAEDVVASTTRYQRIGYRTTLFAKLDKVEAVDDYTVVYHLTDSDPLFGAALGLPGMGMFFIYPAELCDEAHDTMTIETAIGTGPYKYSEYVVDDHVTMVKFEEYVPDTGIPASNQAGERIAYFDTVKWVIVPNAAQRLNGLIAGEYQYADDLEVASYATLESTDGIEPVIVEYTWTPCSFLNTMAGPMKNVLVREAFLTCLNMDECLYAAMGGNEKLYTLNPSPFTKDQLWWMDASEGKYNANDVEKAKALLAEAGYKGEEIKWMVSQDYPFMYQIAVVAQQQAAEAGLNIVLDVRDWGTCAAALVNGSREKEWDIFTTAMSFADVADPSGIDSLLTTDQPISPYDSAEMTEIMYRGHNADEAVRVQAYQDMQKLMYKDLPIIIYGNLSTLSGQADNVGGEPQGLVIHAYNTFYEG